MNISCRFRKFSEKLSTASRFTNTDEYVIMRTSIKKGQKSDDDRIHDQQTEKASEKTRF